MGAAVPRRPLPQIGAAAPPPFRLPGSHFAAALGWLGVAAVLLPALAPRLADGRVFEPPVLALVHVVALGVVGSTIFGALYQFVPGGLGVPLRSVRAGLAGFWALQSGVATLVAGLWWWSGPLQLAGWFLLLAAVGAVSVNVLQARRRSVQGKQIGLYLSVAHSALGFGMAIAFARIGETLGWWHVGRLGLLAAHALLGLVGFGTLTAVGVGSRMLTTFLQAPGDDRRPLTGLLCLASGALGVFGVGIVFGWELVAQLGGVLLVATGIGVSALGVRWFRRRGRALDPALWHVVGAFAALVGATLLGAGLLVGGPTDLARWAALVVAALCGWLVLLVVGVMAKIVSHLSYINLFSRMPGFAAIGDPNLLLRADWLAASGACLTAGALGLTAAIDLGSAQVARMAALLWSAGVAITLANFFRMLVVGRRGPRP